MSEFISRSKAVAIKLALARMAAEQVEAVIPGMAEELAAAAQTGGVEAVRALLEVKCDELDKAVDGLVAAAIVEIQADEED
jgi:Glu-tRNA(Gln) amidotransferase subunit E-like FAD-binding protein